MTQSDEERDLRTELANALVRIEELEHIKAAQEALLEDDSSLIARLRTLLNRSVDSIVLHDRKGKILDANEATWMSLGYSRQEILEMNVRQFDLQLAEIPDESYGQGWSSMKPGVTLTVRTQHSRKDGSVFPVEVKVRPFEQEGEKMFIATMSDISSRLELERERDRAFEQLERLVEDRTKQLSDANVKLRAEVEERQRAEAQALSAQKQAEAAQKEAERASQAKSQFLASMSHELRTPLNAVIGYAELLQEEAEEIGESNMVADLEKIRGAGKHLLSIINDILDLSKIEAGRVEVDPERTDLRELLQQCVETARPLCKKNQNELLLDFEPELGHAVTDQARLRQVVLNLLSNAAKFTERGRIWVTARRIEEDGEPHYSIAVKDTGIGISPEQMKKLFNPFTQADASTTRKYGGTGLGLSISQRFCEILGGTLSVHSVFGEGSTFTIELPYARPSSAPQSQRFVARAAPVRGVARKVLVVDDDDHARELLARVLSQEGYAVHLASSGSEGLAMAKKLRPDAMTLDVLMPDLDGWQVLAKMKRDPELSDIPVVVVSMLHDRSAGIALGAAEYLPKPIERASLLKALSRHVGQAVSADILVVDDDPHAREVIRMALERDGWSVEEAEDGREGLSKMSQQRPAAVVLDLMMPNVDGFLVLEEMRTRETLRDVPVIVVTSKDLKPGERKWLSGRVFSVMEAGSRKHDELLSDVRALIQRCVAPGRRGKGSHGVPE